MISNYYIYMIILLLLPILNACKTNDGKINNSSVAVEDNRTLNINASEKKFTSGLFDYDDKTDSLFYELENINGEPLFKCTVKFGNGNSKLLYVPTGSGNTMFGTCAKGCIETSEISTGILGSESIEQYFYDARLNNWFQQQNSTDTLLEQWSIDVEILKIRNKTNLLSLSDIIKNKFDEENFYEIQAISRGIEVAPDSLIINENSLLQYNNLAYYLEQSKAYDLSILILEKITKNFPSRTVAYLNLGDAYDGLGNIIEAKEAYKKYVELMKIDSKEDKIPQRVWDSIK